MIELKIVGDINTVLSGTVTKSVLYHINLEQFSYALGAGSFENSEGLNIGEAIIYENKAYVYVPNQSVILDTTFKSPFLMGISRLPHQNLILNSKLTLMDLYDDLLKRYPKGFVVVGKIHCQQLDVAYLKIAPIFHENINEHASKYWQHEIYNEVAVNIFGVVLSDLNARAFYQNPNERFQLQKHYSHTHALINNQARHLLTQSLIASADLWIGEIDAIT